MIKVTYYVGTCDKDTCKIELLYSQFVECFNELFLDYTFQTAEGVYTMRDSGTIVKEFTFIVTTFINNCTEKTLSQHVQYNCSILKDKLNQESILVEVNKPEVMFFIKA